MKNLRNALVATATAIAYGTAGAQPAVSINGVVDAAVFSGKGESAGAKAADSSRKGLLNGGMTASRWSMQGSEDLGEGLSTFFELSGFIRIDTGLAGRSDAIGPPVNVGADPFFSRLSFVGLRSRSWGSVRMGLISTPMFINSITTNAFGDSMVLAPIQLVTFVGGPLTGGTGWSNSIAYDSPNWSGFSFALLGSASENQGGNNAGGRVRYGQGDFSTSLAWQKVKKNPLTFADGTSPNDTTAWQLAGTYDFKVVKLFAHLGEIENKGTETARLNVPYRIWDLSAAIPVAGTGSVLLGYASRKTRAAVGPAPATASGGNLERKVLTLGYDHYLSKRTDLYAAFSLDRTVTLTLPAPGRAVSAKGNLLVLGIRHRF